MEAKEIAELHMELAPNDKDEWSNADIMAKAYLDLLLWKEDSKRILFEAGGALGLAHKEIQQLKERLEFYVRSFEIADKGDPLIELAIDGRIIKSDRKILASE